MEEDRLPWAADHLSTIERRYVPTDGTAVWVSLNPSLDGNLHIGPTRFAVEKVG